MWRIYLGNIEDKVVLVADGVKLRGKTVPILGTNPGCLDMENTVTIRVKNILPSFEDSTQHRSYKSLYKQANQLWKQRQSHHHQGFDK